MTISNEIDSPNNHILAEDYNKPINSVLVRNVKSNVEYNKNIESLPISNHLNKLYNIQDIYKNYLKKIQSKTFMICLTLLLGNPSSESFSSRFK